MSTLREHLDDYTDAAREIELAGVAVNVLEAMRSAEALRAVPRQVTRNLSYDTIYSRIKKQGWAVDRALS